MFHIDERTVLENYSMKECMADVERAFTLSKTSHVDIPFRTVINHNSEGAHTLYMPSYIEEIEYASIKIASLFPANAGQDIPVIQSLIVLTETKTGKHVATISASALTVLRTGAISGLGTKFMARKDAKVLSVIGCGAQSFGQVQAVMEAREIEQITLYNRTTKRAELLKEKILEAYPDWSGKVDIVKQVDEAVSQADILVSSTSSNKPVFSGEDVKPGTHINAIGSCEPSKQEYDAALLKKADKVVVDTYEGATQEAGGLIIPDQTGEWSMTEIYGELADIIIGDKKGREAKEEITLLDSVGIGYLDTICAASIYEKLSK